MQQRDNGNSGTSGNNKFKGRRSSTDQQQQLGRFEKLCHEEHQLLLLYLVGVIAGEDALCRIPLSSPAST
ncbi:unnamed protein product [Hyaloperonospora brassicae]|uniref:Uncharacterized protein n=1 Tax=Hyaloperonospora brassicae TaxID=162125 RepID=A0AAV0TIL9_HYABA|nr:unnamed protein product [Hyaloperonospora brassicae]